MPPGAGPGGLSGLPLRPGVRYGLAHVDQTRGEDQPAYSSHLGSELRLSRTEDGYLILHIPRMAALPLWTRWDGPAAGYDSPQACRQQVRRQLVQGLPTPLGQQRRADPHLSGTQIQLDPPYHVYGAGPRLRLYTLTVCSPPTDQPSIPLAPWDTDDELHGYEKIARVIIV